MQPPYCSFLSFHRHDHDSLQRVDGKEIHWIQVKLRSLLFQFFPGIKVYFSVGNNDVSLHDSLDSGPNEDLTMLNEIWQMGAPNGYYSVKLDSNLTLIALNTLYFSRENVFATECSHPKSLGARQLTWLKGALSGKKDHRFIIIGHIPPLKSFYFDSCLREYIEIIHKHRHRVVFQTSGHVHTDEIRVLRHLKAPSSFVFQVPAVSPVTNPSYRIYEIDSNLQFNYTQYYAKSNATFHEEYNSSSLFEGSITLEAILNLQKRSRCDWSVRNRLLRYQSVSF